MKLVEILHDTQPDYWLTAWFDSDGKLYQSEREHHGEMIARLMPDEDPDDAEFAAFTEGWVRAGIYKHAGKDAETYLEFDENFVSKPILMKAFRWLKTKFRKIEGRPLEFIETGNLKISVHDFESVI